MPCITCVPVRPSSGSRRQPGRVASIQSVLLKKRAGGQYHYFRSCPRDAAPSPHFSRPREKRRPKSGYEIGHPGPDTPDFFERYGEEFDPQTGMGGIEV